MAIEVVLPMLGVTVEQGTIVEWLKKEGDPVERSEIIFIVEVEKATTEVESPASGILAKILIPEGVEAPILSVAAIITEPGEELPAEYGDTSGEQATAAPQAAAENSQPSGEKPEAAPALSGLAAMPAARAFARDKGVDLNKIKGTGPEGVIQLKDVDASIAAAAEEKDIKASPLARKVAETEGVALEGIEGSGVQGRIMKTDVDRAMKGVSAPAADTDIESGIRLGDTIPMTSLRKVIARRMCESAFQAPHIYLFSEICMDPLLSFRKDILPDFEKRFGLRPSVNDFLIKAVALNIRDFPILNAQIEGDNINIMPEINVGLAAAVNEGLVVPATVKSDQAGLVDIVRQRQDLIQKARDGKLSLPEMARGTFTISSLAQFDVNHFTAIINPPQSGILSVGKTDEKLFMKDGEVKVKRIATMGLSVDHRIIDGAVAADFLQNLKWKLERPLFTFLDL
ncbi:dihydrolipoamide acetyltransferase family protein [Thermodesulfobacteriota bacterium]